MKDQTLRRLASAFLLKLVALFLLVGIPSRAVLGEDAEYWRNWLKGIVIEDCGEILREELDPQFSGEPRTFAAKLIDLNSHIEKQIGKEVQIPFFVSPQLAQSKLVRPWKDAAKAFQFEGNKDSSGGVPDTFTGHTLTRIPLPELLRYLASIYQHEVKITDRGIMFVPVEPKSEKLEQ